MLWYRFALRMGVPVSELKSRIDCAEWAEWCAFFELESSYSQSSRRGARRSCVSESAVRTLQKLLGGEIRQWQ